MAHVETETDQKPSERQRVRIEGQTADSRYRSVWTKLSYDPDVVQDSQCHYGCDVGGGKLASFNDRHVKDLATWPRTPCKHRLAVSWCIARPSFRRSSCKSREWLEPSLLRSGRLDRRPTENWVIHTRGSGSLASSANGIRLSMPNIADSSIRELGWPLQPTLARSWPLLLHSAHRGAAADHGGRRNSAGVVTGSRLVGSRSTDALFAQGVQVDLANLLDDRGSQRHGVQHFFV